MQTIREWFAMRILPECCYQAGEIYQNNSGQFFKSENKVYADFQNDAEESRWNVSRGNGRSDIDEILKLSFMAQSLTNSCN